MRRVKRIRLVIAEPDPFTRATLERALQEVGDITWVEKGTDVVPTVKRTRPDVVILALLLPQEDGFQVIRDLREDPETRPIPILVYSVLEAEDRVRHLGATAFLRKPQPASVLRKMVKRLTGLES